jgi:hypothetical protein
MKWNIGIIISGASERRRTGRRGFPVIDLDDERVRSHQTKSIIITDRTFSSTRRMGLGLRLIHKVDSLTTVRSVNGE